MYGSDTFLNPMMEAHKRNEGSIALSGHYGKAVVSQGRVYTSQATPVIEAISAQSVRSTPSPKSIEQTLSKMMANEALLAREDIVQEVLPVILREVSKGRASALQAAQALQGEAAVSYAKCKSRLKGAHPKDTKIIRMMMSKGQFRSALKLVRASQERVLILMKESSILLAQNKADAYYKTMSQLQDAMTKLGEREGAVLQWAAEKKYSGRMHDASLINCLVEGAKDEAKLAFEARFGQPDASPSAEQELAQGDLAEDELVSLVEAADILQQAADAGVGHEEAIIAPTPEDEQLEIIEQQKKQLIPSNLKRHLTPQNLVIGGLVLGAIYLFTRD